MKYSSCITHPVLFGQPLEKLMEQFISWGFDGMDIPADEKSYPLAHIKPILESYNNKLPVAEITACINPDRDLINQDEKKRRIAIDYIKLCIDTANALSVPYTHMCFITNSSNLSKTPRDKLEKKAIDAIRECANYARDNRVQLLLEPLFKGDTSIINRCDQAIDLFSKALNVDPDIFLSGKTEFGLLLDLFHMHNEESNIIDTIKKCKAITYHVHVADHPRSLDFTRKDSSFVQQGLTQLYKQDYKGYVSFETFHHDVKIESFKHALEQIKKIK